LEKGTGSRVRPEAKNTKSGKNSKSKGSKIGCLQLREGRKREGKERNQGRATQWSKGDFASEPKREQLWGRKKKNRRGESPRVGKQDGPCRKCSDNDGRGKKRAKPEKKKAGRKKVKEQEEGTSPVHYSFQKSYDSTRLIEGQTVKSGARRKRGYEW